MSSDTRVCQVCAAPFSRDPHQMRAIFEKRKYCSAACYAADKAAKARAKLKPRTCEHCKQTYHPPAAISRPADWTERRYCSDACSHAARIKHVPSKNCLACGAQFSRPLGTSAAYFAGQKYCSKRCADIGRRRPRASCRPVVAPAPVPVRASAPVKLPPGKVETIAEFLARKGSITRCPPAFAAPSDHYSPPSPEDAAAFRRHHEAINATVRDEHVARAKRANLASIKSGFH